MSHGEQRSLSNILAEDGPDALLTTAEAARLLRLRDESLRRMRSEGTGPDFVRVGAGRGKIFYRAQSLRDYLEQRTVAAAASN